MSEDDLENRVQRERNDFIEMDSREAKKINWKLVWEKYKEKNPRDPLYPTQEIFIEHLIDQALAEELEVDYENG